MVPFPFVMRAQPESSAAWAVRGSGVILACNINDATELLALEQAALTVGRVHLAMLSRRALVRADPSVLLAIARTIRGRCDLIRIGFDHVSNVADEVLVHRRSLETIDFVMVNGSHLALASNVALLRDARRRLPGHIALEGEVGRVAESYDARHFTRAHALRSFLRRAPVNFVALSVGNLHGTRTNKPRLRLSLLADLCVVVDSVLEEHGTASLALHGCDHVADVDLCAAIRLGVRKLNFGPEHRRLYYRTLRAVRSRSSDPRDLFERARDALIAHFLKKNRRLHGA